VCFILPSCFSVCFVYPKQEYHNKPQMQQLLPLLQQIFHLNIPPGAADQTISQSSVSCPIPMSSGDYQNALNAISNADGENRKLCLARDIMSSNCLLAEQVKGFMELFQQEISKLEFAKLAYEYTYDKGNYSTVNAAFQDASSAGKLSGYLSGSSH
jgi:hypothetical protein